MDAERETAIVSELLSSYPNPVLRISDMFIVETNLLARTLLGSGWIGKPLELLLGEQERQSVGDALNTGSIWICPEWLFRGNIYKLFLFPFGQSALLLFLSGPEVSRDEELAQLMLGIDQQLRTQLTGMFSQIKLMGDSLPASDSERARHYLDGLQQTTFRILRLSNNLRDMAKFLQGFETLEPVDLDIVELSSRVIRESAAFAELHGVELRFRCDQRQFLLAGDAQWLERMLFNLLSNSVNYSRNGGSVTVTLSIREEAVLLSVADNGIGMDGSALMAAFTQYRQFSGQLPDGQRGMGLGLPLVQAIARLHGGSVLLESRLGEGTTVTVALPAKRVYNEPTLYDKSVDYTGDFSHVRVEFSCLPISSASSAEED